MIGSLAGDDTALIIMRDNASAAALAAEIEKLIKN